MRAVQSHSALESWSWFRSIWMLRPISSRSLAIFGISLYALCPTISTHRRLPYICRSKVSSKPHVSWPASYVKSKTFFMGNRLAVKLRDGCRVLSCCWKKSLRSYGVVVSNIDCRVELDTSNAFLNASRLDSRRLAPAFPVADMINQADGSQYVQQQNDYILDRYKW